MKKQRRSPRVGSRMRGAITSEQAAMNRRTDDDDDSERKVPLRKPSVPRIPFQTRKTFSDGWTG